MFVCLFFINICTFIYIYIYIYICLFIYVSIRLFMYVLADVLCICLGTYCYIYIYIYIYIHVFVSYFFIFEFIMLFSYAVLSLLHYFICFIYVSRAWFSFCCVIFCGSGVLSLFQYCGPSVVSYVCSSVFRALFMYVFGDLVIELFVYACMYLLM